MCESQGVSVPLQLSIGKYGEMHRLNVWRKILRVLQRSDFGNLKMKQKLFQKSQVFYLKVWCELSDIFMVITELTPVKLKIIKIKYCNLSLTEGMCCFTPSVKYQVVGFYFSENAPHYTFLNSNFYVIMVLQVLRKWNVTDNHITQDGNCFTLFRLTVPQQSWPLNQVVPPFLLSGTLAPEVQFFFSP